jgi:hypothetical protein
MNRETSLKYLYISLSAIVFLYVLIRAINVGITYDEACTIMDIVPQTWMDILTYRSATANNHLLNTLLIKLFYLTGNHSVFVSRLPNILAFILYLFFTYKLVRQFSHTAAGLACFALLNLNAFILDFFGLARGYGLTLAFQAGALFYLVEYIRSEKGTRELIALLIFSSLSVLSNFSSVHFFLAVLSTAGLFALIYKKSFTRLFLYSALFISVLGLVIWEPVMKLKENGHLWYGGDTGFYTDTLRSLSKYTLYTQASDTTTDMALNCFLIVFFAIIIFSFFIKQSFIEHKNIFAMVLLFCFLSIFLQHIILHNFYVIDRTALFLYPLFIITLVSSLEKIKIKWQVAVLVPLLVAFGWNFVSKANFYKTATWFFDAHTRQILAMINKEGLKQKRLMTVDYSWLFDSSAWYYLNTGEFPMVKRVENQTAHLSEPFDYYIFLDKRVDKTAYDPRGETIQTFRKDTVAVFPEENIYLFTNASR